MTIHTTTSQVIYSDSGFDYIAIDRNYGEVLFKDAGSTLIVRASTANLRKAIVEYLKGLRMATGCNGEELIQFLTDVINEASDSLSHIDPEETAVVDQNQLQKIFEEHVEKAAQGHLQAVKTPRDA